MSKVNQYSAAEKPAILRELEKGQATLSESSYNANEKDTAPMEMEIANDFGVMK